MGAYSRSTYIRELPGNVVRDLESQLNFDNRWHQFLDNVPKNLNDKEFVPKYTALDKCTFARLAEKPNGSPTRNIIYNWGTLLPTVGHLILVLQNAKLYSSVKYLVEDFLQEHYDPPGPHVSGFPQTEIPPPTIHIVPSHYRKKCISVPVGASNSTDDDYNLNRGDKPELYKVCFDTLFFSDNGGSDTGGLEAACHSSEIINHQGAQMVQQPVISSDTLNSQDNIPHVDYSDISRITENFDTRDIKDGGRLIASGGFGSVFLGVDYDGTRVAVKRIEDEAEVSVKQFKNELMIYAKLRHANLLPLLAYSCDTPKLCIVYEFMSGGSLQDRLACKNNTPALPPSLRVDIASGTAHGILHLNDQGFVHRDIKSANILLDEKFTAKLGDFGTVRCGPSGAGATVQKTSVTLGTTVYLAPEAHNFDVSTKLDSFSFGIVILELLTGLPAFDLNRENKDLRSHCLDESTDIADMLDNKGGSWSIEVANSLFKIAGRCLHLRKIKRVNVSQIIDQLDEL